MSNAISLYLKLRKVVVFMANPLCYLTSVPFLALYAVSTPGGLIEAAILSLWHLLQGISSFLFFAGTGPETPWMHLTLTLTLPSSIALIWWCVEKITGVQSRLKRFNYID